MSKPDIFLTSGFSVLQSIFDATRELPMRLSPIPKSNRVWISPYSQMIGEIQTLVNYFWIRPEWSLARYWEKTRRGDQSGSRGFMEAIAFACELAFIFPRLIYGLDLSGASRGTGSRRGEAIAQF